MNEKGKVNSTDSKKVRSNERRRKRKKEGKRKEIWSAASDEQSGEKRNLEAGEKEAPGKENGGKKQ